MVTKFRMRAILTKMSKFMLEKLVMHHEMHGYTKLYGGNLNENDNFKNGTLVYDLFYLLGSEA